ncbi:sigma 54 modulation/S30EA ribosomal C-terminal domain-containing protein [Mycolicibacterium sp. 22603]|uniref:sigma 54 modulation/S30EA ribosomal C-terminal domain-containing protein n=1 Tax=Mycolicibacterium sp. 22603 TaxID=3453950 RepID=UPI003F841335
MPCPRPSISIPRSRASLQASGLRLLRRGPHATDSPTPCARADDTARIVRRASYAMAPCTVDDAVVEMTLLGYRFHLFNEIGSGTAAVGVSRRADRATARPRHTGCGR